MNTETRIPFVLLLVGVLGLLATGAGALSAPAWAWLGLVAGGLGHSILWRAAGVRKVSTTERRKHEVRLRNAERRERRLIRIARRTEQRVKEVLARGVDVAWAEKTAGAVRELQGIAERHEEALQRARIVTDRTAEKLGSLFQGHLTPEER